MAVLSNTEIQKAIDEGRLIIDPEPLPRTPGDGGRCRYDTCAVDLLLGNEFQIYNNDQPVSIDLTQGKFKDLPEGTFKSITRDDNDVFELKPKELVLGRTLERVELPLIEGGRCLAARVEGKSSYARCGLLVHFTAPTIHAGFSGTITLELINLGNYSITLRPGHPICQLIVERVDGDPFEHASQFQNQSRPAGLKA